jgi:hypothetical protein
MEPNTAAQRTSAVASASIFSNYSMLAAIKPQPVRRETEYGCVDWYPYAAAADTSTDARSEWFEFDDALAA